jgi:hypothetical protein
MRQTSRQKRDAHLAAVEHVVDVLDEGLVLDLRVTEQEHHRAATGTSAYKTSQRSTMSDG